MRDGCCFVWRLDSRHVCRDQWGQEHAPDDLDRLSVDHVHDGGGLLGRRAPSDAAHLVAMCHAINVGGPSRAVREAERDYLAGLSHHG